MRIKTRNKVNVNFSMSGMTDIVFLLLLFFMITSTLIAPNALKLLIPQQGQSGDVIPSIPEVELMNTGIIIVDGTRVGLDQLAAILSKKLSGQSDPAIKLITASGVTVKETVQVMNIAAKDNYKVVLKKE